MLPPIKARLKWLIANWFPAGEASAETPRLLDIGRYDREDGERAQILSQAGPVYHRLPPADPEAQESPAADPCHWPRFSDGHFDLVVGLNALEHVKFPWLTVAEAARVLKAGGRLCLIEPGMNQKTPERNFSSFNKHSTLPDYYRFSAEGLAALAESAGLEVRLATMNQKPAGPEEYWDWFAFVGITLLVAEKPGRAADRPVSNDGSFEIVRPKPVPPPPPPPPPLVGPPWPPLEQPPKPLPAIAPNPPRRPRKGPLIVIAGGCVTLAGARYLSRAATDAEVRFYIYDNSLVDMQIRRHMSVFPFPSEIQRVTRNADLAIVSASPTSASARAYVEKHRKGRPIILCPMTPFGGYFPDFEYYAGPVINQRSALSSRIVLECYLRNYSPEKALSFFNENTFARLGYFQAWDAGINVLSDHFKDAGLDLASFLPGWLRKGVFMQDHLHPQNFVIEDLFAHLASSHGVELKAPSTQEDLLPLTFLDIMPVYPEIAERLNIPQYGSYSFKVLSTDRQTTYSIELDEFIHWSYHNYRNDAQLTQRLQSLPHTKRPFPRLEEL